MTALRKIDVHAHILSEETMSLMRKEAPKNRAAAGAY